MPFGYSLQSSTAAVAPFTTNGTTNTETDFLFLKPGTGAKTSINQLIVQGAGSGLTSLSGMMFNLKNWTTASTGGTAMTPRPDSLAGAVAAQTTAAYNPTAGSGCGTYRGGCGCGASGPGGWTSPTPDQAVEQAAGSAGSVDWNSAAVGVSLNFQWWAHFTE